MITVTPDAGGRAGTAQVRFPGSASQLGSPSLRIRRDGWEDGILGPNGWQGEDAWLQPDEVAADAADLLLTVGWTVCRHLQADTYLVSLSRPDTEGPVAWPDIRPVRAAPRTRPRGPVPTAPPSSEQAAPRAEVAPIVPQPPAPPPVPIAAGLATGNEIAALAEPPQGSKRGLLLGAGALALLVLAGVGYWVWHGRSGQDAATVASATASSPPAPTPQAPVQPAPTPPAPPAAQPSPRALADMSVPDVLAHAPDLPAVTAEGQRRLAGQRRDDGLLLLEEAADRGDGGAMAALGALYDPVGFQPSGALAKPDARQAAHYYQSAERANAPGIAAKREALRAWLQAKSAAGDLQAGLVLKDFWP